jgi:probable HAF family extracellular repeat protein
MGSFATRVATATLSGLAVLPLSVLASGYSLTALAPLSAGKSSYTYTLNAHGSVVGEAYVSEACPFSQWVSCLVQGYASNQPRAVVWPAHAARPSALNCLPATLPPSSSWDKPCEALGLNSRGAMVGRSYFGADATWAQKPVLWASASAAPLDLSPQLQNLPPYVSARAVGINDEGWILGRAVQDTNHNDSARSEVARPEYAFLLHDGSAITLPNTGASSVQAVALNSTLAVGNGQYDKGGQSGVILWALGGLTTTLRSIDGSVNHVYAEGLSSAGHMAGFYWSPSSGEGNKAFVWYQGRALSLPTAPGHTSHAYAVNALGQVVGSHCAAGQDPRSCHATVWTNGVRQDLHTLLTAPSGQTLVQATGINDRGQITGWMLDAGHTYRAFLLTPQP